MSVTVEAIRDGGRVVPVEVADMVAERLQGPLTTGVAQPSYS